MGQGDQLISDSVIIPIYIYAYIWRFGTILVLPFRYGRLQNEHENKIIKEGDDIEGLVLRKPNQNPKTLINENSIVIPKLI